MSFDRTNSARKYTPAPKRRSVLTVLAHWVGLRRSRRALAQLDAKQLRDIGVTPQEARKEAQRSFWDAPTYWR